MLPRSLVYAVASFAGLWLGPPAFSQNSAGEPKMQVPPDQAAYTLTKQIADPAQRIQALEKFLRDFPNSGRDGSARDVLLALLTAQQPQDVARIHTLATTIIGHADQDSRDETENGVAYTLAEAPLNGVDLQSAERWIRHSVDKDTLARATEQTRKQSAQLKFAMPSDAMMQRVWAEQHAARLQTLADVYLHEGKLAEATVALDRMSALTPTDGSLFATRGQVLHAQHRDAEALEQLKLADLHAGHTVRTRALMFDLYAAAHGGDRASLQAELDARYRANAKPFAPPPRTPSPGRRTVLLELYTGSACTPCVAADAAFDAVLQTYARTEVVALAFDEHQPAPDPLANPASMARGEYGLVQGPPTVRVDGDFVGYVSLLDVDARKRKYYDVMTQEIDHDLQTPTGVELQLHASFTPERTVAVDAAVHIADEDALKKVLVPKPAKKFDPADRSMSALEMPPLPDPMPEPKLVLNLALVQKEVTYSGENGVRFHSMVVRDLAKPLPDEFPVALHGKSTASYTFDPSAIRVALSKYLQDYERLNSERFASGGFLIKDTALPLDELAVAAWIEDVPRHLIVASAFAPIGEERKAGAQEKASR